MADYASLNVTQDPATKVVPNSGTKLEEAEDGSIRGRSLFDVSNYAITIIHSRITTTEKNSIVSFYATNKDTVNTWTHDADSIVYNVFFLNEPVPTWLAPNVWNVKTLFKGHKQ